jgi:hypothetical protein
MTSKKKILFFIDSWFFNFGMAKFLQEKYDADYYAILNFEDKSEKFFKKQNIVKFKKTWFLQEIFSNKLVKPDLSYLEGIEKKYKINLWALVFSDPVFYKFNKFYNFNDNEILFLLQQECKFFENILDEINPDFLSIFTTTMHFQELLSEICRSRNIKLLILSPIRLAGRLTISEESIMIDNMDEKFTKSENTSYQQNEIMDFHKNTDQTKRVVSYISKAFEEHKLLRYNAIAKFFLSQRNKNYRFRYYNFGKSRSNVLKVKISNYFNKKIRNNFINKHLTKEITSSSKYIYFPLHTEPERVILLNAPFYTNQISVIENIAKSIPVGYKLLVKEHPAMKILGWRSIFEYKQILRIPNVELLHPSVEHEIVIKKSDLIITIAGSSGLEAAFYGKPAIAFTKQFYSCLPSVTVLEKINDLPKTIAQSLKKKVDTCDLSKFIDVIEKNTFLVNDIDMSTDFAFRFGFKGPIMDGELDPDEVQKFINDYEDQFQILADEHFKKIQEHE